MKTPAHSPGPQLEEITLTFTVPPMESRPPAEQARIKATVAEILRRLRERASAA